MLSINTKSTYRDLESAEETCRTTQILQVATQWPSYSFGVQASLLQLMITWARSSSEATLLTYAQGKEDLSTQISNLVATDHGLVAVLLAKRILSAGREDITDKAKQIAGRRYAELKRVEVKGGRFSLLIFDDHPYVPRAAPFVGLTQKLPEDRARRKDTFSNDLRFQIAQCFRALGSSPLKDGDFGSVLDVIYELFANTEEWGTSDISFAPLQNSARGILGQVIPFKIAAERAERPDMAVSRSFAQYVQALATDRNLRATHFLQISVFDSGIGLAQRNLNAKINSGVDIHSEYSAVLNCLRKRNTSSHDVTRGMGLFEVMRLLTRLKGFFRFRSGRLSLFRDFVEDPFLYAEKWAGKARTAAFGQGFEYLWDAEVNPMQQKHVASTEKAVALTQKPSLEGTLITFWIPLKDTETQLGLQFS
jgi:hypothetical protein